MEKRLAHKKAQAKPATKNPKVYRAPKSGSPIHPVALPGPELKSVDIAGTLSLDNNGLGNGHTALINGLFLGTERYQRIGRRVNARRINIRCFVYTSAASPAVIDDLFRFSVVFDEQPSSIAAVTAASLWQQVSSAGATSTNMLSYNNRDNSMRYKTLRTHMVQINAEQQATETYKDRILWEWDIPVNYTTQYNAGTAGTIADITTGALYFVAHGNNSAVAQWSVDYSVRYKYTD